MVVTLSQQYNNTGEKPTVILYTYIIISRYARTPDKNKNKTTVVVVHN